jgi:hypothetical protein
LRPGQAFGAIQIAQHGGAKHQGRAGRHVPQIFGEDAPRLVSLRKIEAAVLFI